MNYYLAMLVFIIPFALTLWNIISIIKFNETEKFYNKIIEIIALIVGFMYLSLYLSISNIVFENWDVPLPFDQKHSIIAPDSYLTILTIVLVALLGYLMIRFIPVEKLSPLLSALGIAALYLGIGICVLWCIQTGEDFFLILFPLNIILIFIKTICIFVNKKSLSLQNGTTTTKFKKLSVLLDKATKLPLAALIFVVPLLGVIIIVLMLFGQEPDSILKAWTETADWTMSQKIPPQNIPADSHYLCTVAAGGHRRVVKPIRTGIRHGHRVVVNRQLCVANAFEQVLEEKLPKLHKVVRRIYDNTGYPISKHIRSKYTADVIYYLMKPLEWIFLIVLYTVDVKPENRIALQYPHKPI